MGGARLRTVVLIRVPGCDGGQKYGAEYEIAAREGVRRTSDAEVRVLHPMNIGEPLLRCGWWSKLWLFAPDADLPETVHFLDLDTVFLRDLDRLLDALDAMPHDVVGLGDYMRPSFASGIMRIRRNTPTAHCIWNRAREWNFRRGHGDQDLIRMAAGPENLGMYTGDLAPSYKVAAGMVSAALVHAGGRNRATAAEDLADASVLVFHGAPRPHEVAADPGAKYHRLVKENWNPCVSA